MKKAIKLYFLITAMFLVCTVVVNAQQKPSDRSFKEELKKVNEKKAARNVFINKMQQSTPADQKTNTGARTTFNPVPATTNQALPNMKPSQQLMRIPQKPVVLKH